ncbi:MAG: YdcF family protein [Eggerthellaceae bacterium]|nr:YdcF family protein [Eggerthellaceae bacterium]
MVIAAVLVVAITNAITILSTRGNVHTVSDAAEEVNYDADAIVVLGASVYADGTPSDMLRDRLDTAYSLYEAGAAPAIIVSGDNRTSHYNETTAMKDYLISLGVPSEAIYQDHEGYSTYDSMYRAKNVFGVESVIVTTQAYHLYRAMSIAQGLGMETVGVASDHGEYQNQSAYSLREVFARTKDFFKTMFKVGVSITDGDGHIEAVDLNLSGDLT